MSLLPIWLGQRLVIALLPLMLALSAGTDTCNLYCGYWWLDGWVPGLVSQETRFTPIPQVVTGGAVFYGPGVMEATADYYGLEWSDEILDGVSLLTCAEIGHKVFLKRPGFGWEGPFLVADCSQRDDLYAHVFFRDEVVEVGFQTAERWGMATRTGSDPWYKAMLWRIDGVKVSRVPPQEIDTRAVAMDEWFASVLTFAQPKDDRCRLVYHAPNSEWNPDNEFPRWRVNCEWVTFYPPRELTAEERSLTKGYMEAR